MAVFLILIKEGSSEIKHIFNSYHFHYFFPQGYGLWCFLVIFANFRMESIKIINFFLKFSSSNDLKNCKC